MGEKRKEKKKRKKNLLFKLTCCLKKKKKKKKKLQTTGKSITDYLQFQKNEYFFFEEPDPGLLTNLRDFVENTEVLDVCVYFVVVFYFHF